MSKYITKSLGDVTSLLTKGIVPQYVKEITLDAMIVLNQKCNKNNIISIEQARLNDCTKKVVPVEKILQRYDVLINSTGTGTAGRVAQLFEITKPMTIDGHMILIRPTDEVDPIYYGYAVKSHQREIEMLAEGSTGQTEINRKRLSDEIMISFPENIGEQRKISRFLYIIDKKIAINKAINDNLADQIQAIYYNEYDSIRHMPSGILSDICHYSTDKVLVSELSLSTYYSTENMQPNKAGAVVATSLPSISQTTKCHKGDVLVSNIRPYFKKIVYATNDCGCSTDVLCFSPKENNLSAFLFGTLYIDRFFDYMVAGSKGTKMPRGDKQQIMNYPIVIPSEESLTTYNKTVIPMLKQIACNHTENKQLIDLRDILLPKLISGEIDVSEINL